MSILAHRHTLRFGDEIYHRSLPQNRKPWVHEDGHRTEDPDYNETQVWVNIPPDRKSVV